MPYPPLPPKEISILTQLAYGASQKKIARDLNISYSKCLLFTKELKQQFDETNITECFMKAYNEGLLNKQKNGRIYSCL